MYVVQLEPVGLSMGFQDPDMIQTGLIIPSVSDTGDDSFLLNVTTNSTLNTNMFYQATLITAMDTVEAGSFLFCKCM